MATFVLVHGAMHGGWCWRDVRRILTAAGHEAHSPTLAGQGDRRQDLRPEIGVTTHVEGLADLLWFEDLHDVHLVLHSYAGVLAGPLAERAEGRLASVTLLGAFHVEPGQCLLDVEPPEVAARYREQAAAGGQGWRLQASPQFLEQWGVTDDRLRSWVGPRLTDFPFRCQVEPVLYDPAPLGRLPTAYVRHTDPGLESLAPAYDHAVSAGWATADVPCGHDMMLAAPEATVEALRSVTGT